MLLLSFEAALGAGRNALPAHLGGVLHGLVDAAALATSPSLLSVLRPTGANSAAAYAVMASPQPSPWQGGGSEATSFDAAADRFNFCESPRMRPHQALAAMRCRQSGYEPPRICTPAELMGDN